MSQPTVVQPFRPPLANTVLPTRLSEDDGPKKATRRKRTDEEPTRLTRNNYPGAKGRDILRVLNPKRASILASLGRHSTVQLPLFCFLLLSPFLLALPSLLKHSAVSRCLSPSGTLSLPIISPFAFSSIQCSPYRSCLFGMHIHGAFSS